MTTRILSLAAALGLTMIGLAQPLHAEQTAEKSGRDEAIGLWLAASDIDLLGAQLASWLPRFDFEDAAPWRYLFSTKDDQPHDRKNQPAFGYLEVAGPWSIAKGIMLRAGVTHVAEQGGLLVTGAPPPANANGFGRAYEMLGRHVFVTLSATF
jgi:hypothetical protein